MDNFKRTERDMPVDELLEWRIPYDVIVGKQTVSRACTLRTLVDVLRGMEGMPATETDLDGRHDEALGGFLQWFRANYHGTVEFSDPYWHARSIYRVAKRHFERERAEELRDDKLREALDDAFDCARAALCAPTPNRKVSVRVVLDVLRGRIDDAIRDAPIDVVLHCPKCGEQHIDAPEWQHQFADNGQGARDEQEAREAGMWVNDPHRSHLCHGCGHIWRPADVPTNGVSAIKTKGKADSPAPGGGAPIAAAPEPPAESK